MRTDVTRVNGAEGGCVYVVRCEYYCAVAKEVDTDVTQARMLTVALKNIAREAGSYADGAWPVSEISVHSVE